MAAIDLFDPKLMSDAPGMPATLATSLEELSSDRATQDRIVSAAAALDSSEPTVDYSDFKNFVCFNSALDYFNVTGERILNEYPYDGTVDDVRAFWDESDGYQRHVLRAWPRRSGYYKQDPWKAATYVRVVDRGVDQGYTRTGILSPGTGSYTVEGWIRAEALPSNSASIVFQKMANASTSSLTVYLTGSSIALRVCSGAVDSRVSASIASGVPMFFAAVVERTETTGTIVMYTGSAGRYPVAAKSAALGFATALDLGTGSVYLGSGSYFFDYPNEHDDLDQGIGPVVRFYCTMSASLDDVRVWKRARTAAEMSSSFNAKTYAQAGLVALWRFNETGSVGQASEDQTVLDHSGHRLHGQIVGWTAAQAPELRQSGSFVYEEADPVLAWSAPEVTAYISQQQESGSLYDRANGDLLTNMVPEELLRMEDEAGNRVGRDFLYLMGRHFDWVKVRIGQLLNARRSTNGEFDQAPDAFLGEALADRGWAPVGGFVDVDALRYVLGSGLLTGTVGNQELDVKLNDVKNQLWRRTLASLPELHKARGTREGVEAVLRLHGLSHLARVKERARHPRVSLATSRRQAERSVCVLMLESGSTTAYKNQSVMTYPPVTGSVLGVELDVMFPLSTDSRFPAGASIDAGTNYIFTLQSGSGYLDGASSEGSAYALTIAKPSVGSLSGTLTLTSVFDNFGTAASVEIANGLPICDGKWYHIAMGLSGSSASFDISRYESGAAVAVCTATVEATIAMSGNHQTLYLGHGDIGESTGTFGAQRGYYSELRAWSRPLSASEARDHCVNFRSVGTRDPASERDDLLFRIELGDTMPATAGFHVSGSATEGRLAVGYTGSLFPAGAATYRRMTRGYAHLVAGDGWSEDKVRVVDGSSQRREDTVVDEAAASVEYGLTDALDEDISRVMSSLEAIEHALASPGARHGDSYSGLDDVRREHFRKLKGDLNYGVLADYVELIDRSLFDVVARMVPARAAFAGDEMAVESHCLERSKVAWGKRLLRTSHAAVDVGGTIGVYGR